MGDTGIETSDFFRVIRDRPPTPDDLPRCEAPQVSGDQLASVQCNRTPYRPVRTLALLPICSPASTPRTTLRVDGSFDRPRMRRSVTNEAYQTRESVNPGGHRSTFRVALSSFLVTEGEPVRWKNSYEGLDALVAERGSALLGAAVLLAGS